MNYRHIYMLVIEHAKSEEKLGLRKKGNGNYYERHHILPKSLFPLWTKNKRNLVLLTAREHFFCHQLLTKIYPTPQMFCALKFLATDGQNKYCKSKDYERIRIECIENSKDYVKAKRQEFLNDKERSAHFREVASENLKQVNKLYRQKCIEKMKEVTQSDEYREKRSEQTKHFYKEHPEYKQLHSEYMRNWCNNDDYKKQKSDELKLRWQNPDEKRKLLDNLNKFRDSPEGRKACSDGGKKSGDIAKEKAKRYKEYKANGGTLSWNEFQKNVNIIDVAK